MLPLIPNTLLIMLLPPMLNIHVVNKKVEP